MCERQNYGMAHQSIGREDTEHPGDVGSTRSSSTLDKREGIAAPDDEEKRLGDEPRYERLRGAAGLDSRDEEIARPSTVDSARPGLAPTRSRAKSLRSIRSHQSRAGTDGYTLNNEDEKPNNSTGTPADDPYLVQWSGDADPMNPRSMTTLRRWCIVLIVSASSLCV